MELKISAFSDNKLLILNMALVNLYSTLSYSIIGPFFPVEGINRGLSPSLVGVIFACYAFVHFLFSIPLVMTIMPLVGSRFMYKAGIFLEGGCSILMGVLGYGPPGMIFFWMSLLVRMFQALGATMTVTCSITIVAEIFPDKISTAVGILELFTGAGLMLGPVIGGFIFDVGGYMAPFAVVGVLCLILLVFTLAFLPHNSENEKSNFSLKAFALLRKPAATVTILIAVINCLSLTFLNPAFQPFLEESFGLSPTFVGLVLLIKPLPYALLSPVWGYLVDGFGKTISIQVIGSLLSGLCFLFINPSPIWNIPENHLWITILSTILLGMSSGAVMVPIFKELMNQAEAVGLPNNFDTYRMIAGLANTIIHIGFVLGPVLSGVMIEALGFPWATSIVGFVNLGVCVLATIYLLIDKIVQMKRKVDPDRQPLHCFYDEIHSSPHSSYSGNSI